MNVRPVGSDLFAAGQIFGAEEYRVPDRYAAALSRFARESAKVGRSPVIIDAGANVGYAALYFAERYPDCRVIAVEADEDTYRDMVRNVAGCERIAAVHSAVWNHCAGVSLVGSDLGSWATRVEDSGLTPSATLSQIMAAAPDPQLVVLKLDIEGAEREVCASEPELLRSAPCILIEPHDFMLPGAGGLAPLYAALAGRRIDTLIRGENLMFFDLDILGPFLLD